jgi:hypothetical protein
MARWTSMSRDELTVRFRAGMAKGRLGWLPYLLQFVALGLISLAVQTVMLVVHHEANAHTATHMLAFAMGLLILFTFVLTLNLRQKEQYQAHIFLAARVACVSAAVVLIVCYKYIWQ